MSGTIWVSNKYLLMNKCMFLTLVTMCRAPCLPFLLLHCPHQSPAPGSTECSGMGWALWACSPNCRTRMPSCSRMSYSSGLWLARGSWHPCDTRPWLRSCPRRVCLSAKERDVFGNAVTRWAGPIFATLGLSKQVHLGLRAPQLQ